MTKSKVAVLVISCDKYSDLWDPFMYTLNKFWKDCPFDKFFLTNHLEYNNESITSLKIGDDLSWSDGIYKALLKLENYEYLLFLMEDTFISKTVNTKLLISILDSFYENNGNYITLINEPKHDRNFNKLFGEILPGSLYRTTVTFAVWKRETLLELLDRSENAWEFEKNGTARSDKYNGFFSVYNDLFEFIHGVIKRKWLPQAIKDLELVGYQFEKIDREVLSDKQSFKRDLYKTMRKLLLQIIPRSYHRRIANLKGNFKNI